MKVINFINEFNNAAAVFVLVFLSFYGIGLIISPIVFDFKTGNCIVRKNKIDDSVYKITEVTEAHYRVKMLLFFNNSNEHYITEQVLNMKGVDNEFKKTKCPKELL
jgi:hypothetical protein